MKKRCSIWVDKDLWRNFRATCSLKGMSCGVVLEQLVEDWLASPVPVEPRMSIRKVTSIGISGGLWQAFAAKCVLYDTHVSDVLENLIEQWLEKFASATHS